MMNRRWSVVGLLLSGLLGVGLAQADQPKDSGTRVSDAQESRADITIAMGFAGHMLIELIQPLDDEPSVYQETIALRGHGFHHLGIACADVDADSRDYQARGYHEAFRATVPTGGEVVYLDNGSGAQLGFIELLPVTPGMDATFTRFWEASRAWDGNDPVRSFL